MNLENHFYLGKITKLYGFKGEVIFYLDVDQPDDYKELPMVFVKSKASLVPHFIEKFQHKKEKNFRVKIEGIDDEESAMHLVNKELYLPLNLLPKLEGNKFYFHEVIDFKVYDEHEEELGSIKRVIDLPSNPLFEILSETRGELLIPIKDDFLLEVNRQQKRIKVSLPEGFEDLYI